MSVFVYQDDKQMEEMRSLVERALDEQFKKDAKKAIDDLTYRLHEYIEYTLQDDLSDNIAAQARHLANDFLKALAEGKDKAVSDFISAPSAYYDQRKDAASCLLSWGRENGPIELRRKMLEASGSRLEAERVKDLEAERDQLVEIVKQLKDQLYVASQRLGEIA